MYFLNTILAMKNLFHEGKTIFFCKLYKYMKQSIDLYINLKAYQYLNNFFGKIIDWTIALNEK